MSDSVHRVQRPSAAQEMGESRQSSTVSRNTLTLYLSFAAIILSCASAAVNLFTFYSGGQQKMLNEADQISLRAEANRVLQKLTTDPASHPALREELVRLYKELNYRPPFDASLTVFERAAFGLVVEQYAMPIVEVQLRQVQARQTAATLDMDGKDGKKLDWPGLACLADPALCSATKKR